MYFLIIEKNTKQNQNKRYGIFADVKNKRWKNSSAAVSCRIIYSCNIYYILNATNYFLPEIKATYSVLRVTSLLNNRTKPLHLTLALVILTRVILTQYLTLNTCYTQMILNTDTCYIYSTKFCLIVKVKKQMDALHLWTNII